MSKKTTLKEDELKAALWYTTAKICEEEELSLSVAVTEAFVAQLTELVWHQAQTLGKDLQTFAKHANRSQITVEDVFLAARRNPSLTQLIHEEAERHGDLPPGQAKKNTVVPEDSDGETEVKPRAKPKPAQPKPAKAGTSRLPPAKTISSYAGFSRATIE